MDLTKNENPKRSRPGAGTGTPPVLDDLWSTAWASPVGIMYPAQGDWGAQQASARQDWPLPSGSADQTRGWGWQKPHQPAPEPSVWGWHPAGGLPAAPQRNSAPPPPGPALPSQASAQPFQQHSYTLQQLAHQRLEHQQWHPRQQGMGGVLVQANHHGGPAAGAAHKAAGMAAAADDALRECRRLNGRLIGAQNAEASSRAA